MPNDLVYAIDNSQVSAIVLLDLSSISDIVDHAVPNSALLKRFSVYDKVLNWFHRNFSNCYQSFHFAGNQTACFPVDCNVPHGPLEFIVCDQQTVTRSKHRVCTNFCEHTFSYAGPHAWNSPPTDIRFASSFCHFKQLLNIHVLRDTFFA
jgi:hypothetical protein